MSRTWLAVLIVVATFASLTAGASAADPPPASIRTVRVPDDGIQPQAASDGKGVVHLVYFKGDPQRGDLFYVSSADACRTFSAPLRVNSQPGAAIAIGTVRGAHVAVGRS